MKNIDINEIAHQFNQTSFGKRAKFFSIFPFIIAVFLGIYSLVLLATKDEANIELAIALIGFIMSLMTFCITQLLYGKMLYEYTRSLK